MEKLLNFEVVGKSNSKKLLLIAHGLFGSHKNWRTVANSLGKLGWKVVIVDMRNHGLSFWDRNHRYEDLANDLRIVINEFGCAADVIGHSMGGKAAMVLALLFPECVNKLLVVDIAPVKYEHSQLNYINAMESVNLSLATSRRELNKQLSLSISDPTLIYFFSQSVDFSGMPKKKWLLNLNSLKVNLPAIMNFPKLQERTMKSALFVRGSLSDYVLDEYLPAIDYYFPNNEITTIRNAGHWLHIENREEFEARATNFLMG